MRGPIDIDNVENVAREKSEGCGREGEEMAVAVAAAGVVGREGDINLWAVNRREQLLWPLPRPLHLFGNIISTNQGPAKKENGPA